MAHSTMLLFGRPKRPRAKAASTTHAARPQPPATVPTPSPPRQAEQPDDTSLPPRYSRIDYPENLPFAAIASNDRPLYEPAPAPQYPPRLPPQRSSAIEPRAQSSLDLSARFNNVLQIARVEGVQQHQSPSDLGNNPVLCDLIISKLDAVITSIDGETFSGDERELRVYLWPLHMIRSWCSQSCRCIRQSSAPRRVGN